MATVPMSLTPVGRPPYKVLHAHLLMLVKGAWILDVELAADDVALQGAPSGKATAIVGGVPMIGTIDPNATGIWGPTAKVRLVAGAGAWSTSPAAQQFHADNGLPSQVVYSAVAGPLLEVVVDLEPTVLGIDFAVSSSAPAKAIFGDRPWFVDPTGTTYVGPHPPAIPDPSLVIRDWDPINQKATFSCDTLLLPNTPLVDPRFGSSVFTAYNIEQIFDANGSTGWSWAQPAPIPGLQASPPPVTVIDKLKAAVLSWTRAPMLRAYRYRLILYPPVPSPGGGPKRMALQAVSPSAGMPDLLPIAPWSGMAGIVAQLAPSMEVLVVFENADPTLPRVIAYSLVSGDGEPIGRPTTLSLDAIAELDLGTLVALVKLAGGGAPVGRVGDAVSVTLTAAQIGQITAPSGGGPCTGGPITVTGTITSGSPRVQSG